MKLPHIALALSVCALSGTILRGNESTAPNILLCISDDQSWPHASAYGDAVVRTPAFDRIVRVGVLFHHA